MTPIPLPDPPEKARAVLAGIQSLCGLAVFGALWAQSFKIALAASVIVFICAACQLALAVRWQNKCDRIRRFNFAMGMAMLRRMNQDK